MDLNHIELPALLLTDLYKKSLVEGTVAKRSGTQQAAVAAKNGLPYLGSNEKGICLLVSYPQDVYLPDEQLNFLTSILQACKLNLGDVAIVNHAREKFTFEDLRKQLTCNHLLIFGAGTELPGIDATPPFTVQNINDCYIVYSPAAEQLNNNNPESKLLKSKLWNCLKQMFNV